MTVTYTHFLEFIVSYRLKSKSQISQDLFVYYFTNYKKNGFFIEVGACDGVHLSNTFMLEKNGWSGVICEPSRYWNMKIKRRNCIINKKAIFSESGLIVKFDEFPTSPELSGLNNYLVDDNNFVYSFDVNNPEFLGIKENNALKKIDVPLTEIATY